MKEQSVMFMIEEQISPSVNLEILEESKDHNGDTYGLKYRIELQRANEINQNKRKYGKTVLEEADRNYQRFVAGGTAFSEMNHPVTKDVARFTTVDLRNACSRILETSWDGDTLSGIGETLNTSLGRDYRGMLEQGIKLGTSVRALGRTNVNKMTGITEVVSHMKTIAYDVVSNQSHKNSHVNELLKESIILSETIVTDSDVNFMLMSESSKLEILQESLGNDIQLFDKTGDISYNLENNTVAFCTDGSCMTVFLEEHIKDEFRNSFSKYLR